MDRALSAQFSGKSVTSIAATLATCSRLTAGRGAKVIALHSGSDLATRVADAFRSLAVASITKMPAALFASRTKVEKRPAGARVTSAGPVASTTAKLGRPGGRQSSGVNLTDPVARTLCVISPGKNLSSIPVQAGGSSQLAVCAVAQA